MANYKKVFLGLAFFGVVGLLALVSVPTVSADAPTLAQLQAQLAQLQAQLASLQQQLAAAQQGTTTSSPLSTPVSGSATASSQSSASTTTTGTNSSWCYTFGPNAIGSTSSGPAVSALIQALTSQGIFSTMGINPPQVTVWASAAGPLASAVELFQQRYHIMPLAPQAGPKTLAQLNTLFGCPLPTISPAVAAISVGATEQFTALNASSSVTWTVANSTGTTVATIDQNGLLTGVSPGTVTVYFTDNSLAVYPGTTAVQPGKTEVAQLTVVPAGTTPTASNITIGLTARPSVALGGAPDTIMTWSSTNTLSCSFTSVPYTYPSSYAYINGSASSASGSVAVAPSVATVYTLTCNNALGSNSSSVTVNPASTTGTSTNPYVASLSISPTPVVLAPGATEQFTAVAKDQNGNVVVPTPSVNWSSSNYASGSASINQNGLLVAPSATGTINITASLTNSNGSVIVGTAVVTVSANNQSTTTTISATQSTSAGFLPGCSSLSGYSITTGSLCSGASSAANSLNTNPYGITSIVLSPFSLSLAAGSNQALKATDQNGNTLSSQVFNALIWKSNNSSVATVGNGTVFALSGGTATITASYAYYTANAISAVSNPVTVSVTATQTTTPVAPAAPTQNITIIPYTTTLTVGATQQLTATVTTASGSLVFPQPAITWTSADPFIASISPSGLVTAIAPGTASFSASSPSANMGYTGIFTVTSSGAAAPSITLSPNAMTFTSITAGTSQITATNASGSAVSVNYVSSNPSVASVNNSGVVTPISVGTTIITATSGSSTSTSVNVTVLSNSSSQPVTNGNVNISAPNGIINITAGTSQQLVLVSSNGVAVANQASAFASAGFISSDSTIASLSSTGLLTALKAGTVNLYNPSGQGVTVVVSAASNSSTTVSSTSSGTTSSAISSISLTSQSVLLGGTYQFTATDQLGRSITLPLVWTSSKPSIATVDSNGNVTGIAPGSTTITASNGSIQSNAVTLTVAQYSSALNIGPVGGSSGNVGGYQALTLFSGYSSASSMVYLNPSAFNWTSSNPAVASVSIIGNKAYAIGASSGSTTITATDPTTGNSASLTVSVY